MQSVLYWKGQIENGCTISKVRNISISVGSSTVAMTMAAGIIAAMPGINGYTIRRVAHLRPERLSGCRDTSLLL